MNIKSTTEIFTESEFPEAEVISWGDIIKKCNADYHVDDYILSCSYDENIITKTQTCIIKRNSLPTFLAKGDYFPESYKAILDSIVNKYNVSICHTYVSFTADSCTLGRHDDLMDVLLVQSIGCVSYEFDSGKIYKLNPGDSLYIPKGLYHNPIVHEPRATLSFSW